MAHPKRRTSKARKNKRRSHLALTPLHLVTCSGCGQMKQSHRVCAACGQYDKERKISFEKEEA